MRNTEFAARRGHCKTCSGSNRHVLYSSYVDESGVLQLQEVGEENTDEIIESFRESTELSVILSRYLHGDSSALSRYQGFYADLTAVPHTMRDALDIVLHGQSAFDALPLDIRSKYGNDWQRWAANAGNDEWMSNMSSVLPNNVRENLSNNARENISDASPPSSSSISEQQ